MTRSGLRADPTSAIDKYSKKTMIQMTSRRNRTAMNVGEMCTDANPGVIGEFRARKQRPRWRTRSKKAPAGLSTDRKRQGDRPSWSCPFHPHNIGPRWRGRAAPFLDLHQAELDGTRERTSHASATHTGSDRDLIARKIAHPVKHHLVPDGADHARM
jgi:hypothetical protein